MSRENVTAFFFVCLFSLAHISRLYQQKSRTGTLSVGFLSDSALEPQMGHRAHMQWVHAGKHCKKKKKKQQPPNKTNTLLLNLDQISIRYILWLMATQACVPFGLMKGTDRDKHCLTRVKGSAEAKCQNTASSLQELFLLNTDFLSAGWTFPRRYVLLGKTCFSFWQIYNWALQRLCRLQLKASKVLAFEAP